MNNVRKEMRDLISVNEKIQGALLHGDHITDDEAVLIRKCASELLETIPAPSKTWTRVAPMIEHGRPDGHERYRNAMGGSLRRPLLHRRSERAIPAFTDPSSDKKRDSCTNTARPGAE